MKMRFNVWVNLFFHFDLILCHFVSLSLREPFLSCFFFCVLSRFRSERGGEMPRERISYLPPDFDRNARRFYENPVQAVKPKKLKCWPN
jgi:hypothetical protein